MHTISKKTQIFLTGGTGYIGGSVLNRLLNHPKSNTFQITVLVRSPEKASKLKSIGVKAEVGSNTDLDLLKTLTSEADAVFSCADADDLAAVQAILSGLKIQHESTRTVPILIHTSGTGVLLTPSDGLHSTDTIYSDLNVEQLETLAPTQPHRNVDLAIIDADRQGFVKTFIVLPSTIYGIAEGSLVDLGIQNPHSQQIPDLIKVSLDRGQGGMVGQGKNTWPNVSINEVADLYIILFDAALEVDATNSPGHGREGLYFAENGEHNMYELCKVVAQSLHELGKGKSSEPTTLSADEMQKYFPPIGTSLGTNCRCRADRSRSIGWKPVQTTKDMLASVLPEVKAIISKKA